MSNIDQFILKDVRCFAGENTFNIRPLTFLIGENSTGKSTMLGCLQTFHDGLKPFQFRQIREGFDFNQDPYQMGAYADIARKTNKIAKSFGIGAVTNDLKIYISFKEREDGSEPVIKQFKVCLDDGEITIEIEQSTDSNHAEKHTIAAINIREETGNQFFFSISDDIFYSIFKNTPFQMLPFLLDEQSKTDKNASNFIKYLEQNEAILNNIFFRHNVGSSAPIRSKPERTYDPLKENTDSEGSEMPMVLMNLFRHKKAKWESLKKQLEEFGEASGLFDEINVRPFGESTSDPFQIQIKARGPLGNLIDVGYGVSQILPILVRIFLGEETDKFLLQQPEVHLHPRAQAALSSLLIAQAKESKKSFIIETHSDAMVNRARIEIMQGKIKPEDVSLIFLEPIKNKVKVHNICFDENANMSNVPASYRNFFLQEQDRLLGFED